MTSNRIKEIDIVKGILIILMVAAHYERGVFHDIIFLFHMPLFFLISGYLWKDNKSIVTKFKNLIIPYIFYIAIDQIILVRDWSVKGMAKFVWGGASVYRCLLVYNMLFICLFSVSQDKDSAKQAVADIYYFCPWNY